jgi:hypothetical protein
VIPELFVEWWTIGKGSIGMVEAENGYGLYRHVTVKAAMSGTSGTEGLLDIVIFRISEYCT